MMSDDREHAAREFLEYVSAPLGEQYYHLWRKDTLSTFWHNRSTVDSAVRHIVACKQDIYLGVGLADQQYGVKDRLKDATAIGRIGLVADLDVKDGGFADKPAAIAFADSLLIPPTALVDSGGGIQCWWLFDQPWLFDGETDKQHCKATAEGWHEFLAKKAARQNVHLDSVFDLARIMRVPGGLNCKQESPRPVQLANGGFHARLSREVFEDFSTASAVVPAPVLPLEEAPPKLSIVANLATPLIVEPVSDAEIDALIRAIPDFYKAWEHLKQRAEADGSLSSWDLSVANYGNQAQLSDGKIAGLIVKHREKWGGAEKAVRTDYLLRTVEFAKRRNPQDAMKTWVRQQSREAELPEMLLLSSEDRKLTLNTIFRAVGIPADWVFLRFFQKGQEDAHYEVQWIDGSGVLRTLDLGRDLFTQSRFVKTAFDQLGVYLNFKPATWKRLLSTLASVREVIDAYETRGDQLRDFLRDPITSAVAANMRNFDWARSFLENTSTTLRARNIGPMEPTYLPLDEQVNRKERWEAVRMGAFHVYDMRVFLKYGWLRQELDRHGRRDLLVDLQSDLNSIGIHANRTPVQVRFSNQPTAQKRFWSGEIESILPPEFMAMLREDVQG